MKHRGIVKTQNDGFDKPFALSEGRRAELKIL